LFGAAGAPLFQESSSSQWTTTQTRARSLARDYHQVPPSQGCGSWLLGAALSVFQPSSFKTIGFARFSLLALTQGLLDPAANFCSGGAVAIRWKPPGGERPVMKR